MTAQRPPFTTRRHPGAIGAAPHLRGLQGRCNEGCGAARTGRGQRPPCRAKPGPSTAGGEMHAARREQVSALPPAAAGGSVGAARARLWPGAAGGMDAVRAAALGDRGQDNRNVGAVARPVPRVIKRSLSSCSRQQTGVPAKAPTPDFKTGSQAPRGSRRRRTARGSSTTQQRPASTATRISSAAGGHPGHPDFKVNLQARDQGPSTSPESLLSRTFPRPRPPGARSHSKPRAKVGWTARGPARAALVRCAGDEMHTLEPFVRIPRLLRARRRSGIAVCPSARTGLSRCRTARRRSRRAAGRGVRAAARRPRSKAERCRHSSPRTGRTRSARARPGGARSPRAPPGLLSRRAYL